MADLLAKIEKVYKENSANSWRAYNRMQSLTSDQEEGVLEGVLWEAHRQGKVNLGVLDDAWYDLGNVPNLYDGADFMSVYRAFSQLHAYPPPAGQYQYYPWSDDETPGWHASLDDFLEPRLQEHESVAQIIQGLNELPYPYNWALEYRLAKHGMVQVEELPQAMLAEYARIAVCQDSHEGWSHEPWTPEQWARACLEVMEDEDTTRVKSWATLEGLIPWASPRQVVDALKKLPRTTNRYLPALAYFEAHASIYHKILEEVLIAQEWVDDWTIEYDEPDPMFYLCLAYLAACKGVGASPVPGSLARIKGFVQGYKPSFSGGSFEAYHETIQGYLSVVPQAELESYILESPSFPLLIAPACPSQAVVEGLLEYLGTLKKHDSTRHYDFETHVNTCLENMGEDALGVMSEHLQSTKKGVFRVQLLQYVSQFPEHPLAIKAMASCLRDTAKSHQEVVRQGLTKGPVGLVCEALEPYVSAKAKSTRLAAAQLLQSLTPHPKAWALAQAQLAQEKTDQVKEALQHVKEPKEDEGDSGHDYEQAATKIRETNGACWREYEEWGVELLTAMMHAWKRRLGSGVLSFLVWEDDFTMAKAWLEILDKVHDQEGALEHAVGLFGILSESYHDEYIEALEKIYTQEQIGLQLATWLAQEVPLRPAFFESSYWKDTRENVTELVLTRYQDHAHLLIPGMLAAKSKKRRVRAKHFVMKHPDVVDVALLVKMTKSKRKDERETGAELIGVLGDETHVPVLKELVSHDKSVDVKKAAEQALAALAKRAFDLTKYAHDAKDQAKLDADLGELSRVSLPTTMTQGLAKLTPCSWQGGGAMSPAAFEWMLAEISQESMAQSSTLLKGICGRLKTQSVHQLCDDLIEHCHPLIRGWALFMQSTLGSDERIAKTGTMLEEFAKSQNYGWGDHGVEVMVRHDSSLAVRILDDWSRKSRRDALKWRSRAGLERMADARGISLGQLQELAIDDFGFDQDGTRRFDYGSRTLRIKLGVGDMLTITDESSGKILKSMPAANSKDDADKVMLAKTQVSRLKKELKRVRRGQKQRFELAMIAERRWDTKEWFSHYATNPVMRSFAQGIVWGLFDQKSDQLLQAVQLDESGGLVNIEGDVVNPKSAEHKLGVLHPLDLTAAQRLQWVDCFADYEVIESFIQLTRPLHFKKDWPSTPKSLCAQFKGLNPLTFMGRADRLGWEKGPRADAGLVSSTSRFIGPWLVSLEHDGYSPDYADDSQVLYVTNMEVSRDGSVVELALWPDALFSELVLNLMKITGGVDE